VRDHQINGSEQISNLLVAPVCINCLLIRRATAGTAAVIHRNDDISLRRKQLPFETEAVRILTVRTAMNVENQGIFLSLNVSCRFDEDAVDLGSVFASGSEVFVGCKLQTGDEFAVLVCKWTEPAVLDGEYLFRLRGCARQHRKRPILPL